VVKFQGFTRVTLMIKSINHILIPQNETIYANTTLPFSSIPLSPIDPIHSIW